MTDKQTCEGLDCAWCGVLDCPREKKKKEESVKNVQNNSGSYAKKIHNATTKKN